MPDQNPAPFTFVRARQRYLPVVIKSVEPSSPPGTIRRPCFAGVERTDVFAFRRNDQHAAGACRPKVAALIDFQSALRRIRDIEEHAARTQCAVGVHGIRHPDRFRGIGAGDVENFSSGEKTSPLGDAISLPKFPSANFP